MEGQTAPTPASDPIFIASVRQLAVLSEEELLTLIGLESQSPTDVDGVAPEAYVSANVAAWAAAAHGVDSADLVALGRRRANKVLLSVRDVLRDSVCPLLAKGEKSVELALAIASILAQLLPLGTAILAMIAVYIAKYLLDELCEGWAVKAKRQLPATA